LAFINKKEEVIQIELTQYGRRLLSKGKFKPVYYSFYDDEIIYDGKFAGLAEEQNDIETRIKTNIRNSNHPFVLGVESGFLNTTELINEGLKDIYDKTLDWQSEKEKGLLAKSQLAHMSLGEQSSPSFVFKATDDVIVNSKNETGVTFITGSNTIEIPQINVELKYRIFEDRERNLISVPFDSETFIDLMAEKIEFLDGTGVRLEKDELMFELVEENVPYEGSNFEVELFEVITPGGTNDDNDDEKTLIPIDREEEILELFNIRKDRKVDKSKLGPSRNTGRGFFVKE